jgi:hypothetical protein
VALKRDSVTFYRCQINTGDIWLQFKKQKKNCQMSLRYKNIKNKSLNNDISTIDMPPGVMGVSKNPEDQTEDHFSELEC